jgi:hypothetical protein
MNKSINIARGGLFTALGVLFIYLSTIIPTSRLYVLGLASCIIPMSILMTNVKNTFIIYAATSLLSLLIVGFKGNVIAYILFFGLYGFIKFYVERLRNAPYEFILKLLFFNAALVIIYLLAQMFFQDLIKVNVAIYIAIFMVQFIFIVFDYALTLFIAYIDRTLIKR